MTEPIPVLLVDDEPDDPAAAADSLEGERDRFRVAVETNASDALDRLADGDADCVVSGFELSDTDGLAFLDAVRDVDPAVPFLLFTAEGSEAIASAATANGVTEYLPKSGPGDRYAALADRIENAVDDGETDRCGELGPGASGVIRDLPAHRVRERRLRRLHEATRELVEADTAETIAEVVSRTAEEVLDMPVNGVHFFDEDAERLTPVATTESSRELLDGVPVLDSGIGWEAFQTGEPRIHGDVREADSVFNSETSVRSEICLPIRDYGVFIASSTDVNAFDDADVTMAKILVANAETALSTVQRERDLRRQNDRLETIVSIVSHDLRNSLNLALNRLELARRQADGESEHFPEVERALDQISRVIDDTLRFARESRTIRDTEPVELDAFAAQCWARIEAPGASLRTGDLPVIEADPDRLRYVFSNLFRNAVEHGGENVTVSVGPLDDADGFYVEDDGPGIPEAEREDVFDPGHTTAEDGTGFGLTIVAEIVDTHGWDIAMSDGTDGGARFEITSVDAPTD